LSFSLCQALQTRISPFSIRPRSTALYVLANPSPRDQATDRPDEFTQRNNNNKRKFPRKTENYKRTSKRDDVFSSGRWHRAEHVEGQLMTALEALQKSVSLMSQNETSRMSPSFPHIRECNAALADFGDAGDLLRALRLFGKMRKAAALAQRYSTRERLLPPVPSPTLVTYSTMMSRAIYLGKPRVALRLWILMRQQAEFFSTKTPKPSSQIILPDVKAANILMNCHAKLGDIESALDLLDQMLHGGGLDVPRMIPSLVTYNTLLDACHKGGDLDVALKVKSQLEEANLQPDARTYTTLIATVARKASAVSGANDPTLAFSLHQEMLARHVRPNGMTYSALIDVCGRCRRSDLALKGLRIMLDQKAYEQKERDITSTASEKYTLASEVGAWTAAINACGKAGRINTAVKLFYAMPNFGVYPNTVTCGCLTDCLLRQGRTAETLGVLRYMKKFRIAPSEIMYTSLMTSAGRLVQFEKKQQYNSQSSSNNKNALEENDSFPLDESGEAKAIEVYTELITSMLTQGGARRQGGVQRDIGKEDSNELYRVFLVFQEMKAVGAIPDLFCYNALLKTCANFGDFRRAQEVLEQIQSSELYPNDSSWREVVRAAGKAGRVDIALSTWKMALKQEEPRKWKPSTDSLGALVAAIVQSASDTNLDRHTRCGLYNLVVNLYRGMLSDSENSMGMHLVDKSLVLQTPRIMLMFLEAIVSRENELGSKRKSNHEEAGKLRGLATSIVTLDCFKYGLSHNLRNNESFLRAFQIGNSWARNASAKANV
jgi:pentatricopeptide repeat protein